MAYKIIDIEGVGEVYAEKLIAAGIEKVEDLLSKCGLSADGIRIPRLNRFFLPVDVIF